MSQLLLWLKLGFRNLKRNKRRTFLMAFLIGFGLGALIIYDGLVIGMRNTMIRNATEIFLGHAQIHAPEYRDEYAIEKVVNNREMTLTLLAEDSSVQAFTQRSMALGMLSSATNVSAATIFGVEPEGELRISRLKQAVIQGDYLTGTSETEILIGSRLARTLEVEIGDRVVMTAAQAKGGDLAQELYRVSGVVEFGSRSMDQTAVFIPLSRAQKMLSLGKDVHEIGIRFRKLEMATNRSLPLWQNLEKTENEALSWRELSPAIGSVLDITQYSTLIVAGILVGVIALGVINSMFMAIFERMFEFGVLKAVGTRPSRLALMILLEAAALAILSSVFGLILGGGAMIYFSVYGFDFAGMEFAGTSLRDPIRTVPMFYQFTLFPLFVILLTVIAGFYPAISAARVVPADAMRKSM